MKSTPDISASGHRHKRSPCSWKSKKSMESTSTCPLFLEIKEEYGKYVYVSLIFPMHHTRQTHTLGSTAFVAAVVLEGGGVVSGCPRGWGWDGD